MQISWNILSKYRNEVYGFSILWIILFHGLNVKNSSLCKELEVLRGFIKHGNCGVEIFLFLSGMCLYYSFKNNEKVVQFYIKRLKRILIPFFIIDGIYWCYICIIEDNNILQFIKNITFYSFWLEGNKLVWFIALILPLYLFYPILFKFIIDNKKLNRLNYIICLCVLTYILCYLFKKFDYQWYKGIEIALTRIPVFLLGCYCGVLAYENKIINSSIKGISLIIIIFGVGYFYLHPIGLVKTFRMPYLLLGPSIAIWFAICLEVINTPLINTILSKCGRLSLELYLSHVVLEKVFSSSILLGNSAVANFNKYLIFVLCGAFAISIVVYYLEKLILGK